MSKKKNKKADEQLKKILEEDKLKTEKRLDALVVMNRSLYLTKIAYYIFFVVLLVVVIIIIRILFTTSSVVGIMVFVVGFLGLRYILITKILLKKYNEHVEKMYEKK